MNTGFGNVKSAITGTCRSCDPHHVTSYLAGYELTCPPMSPGEPIRPLRVWGTSFAGKLVRTGERQSHTLSVRSVNSQFRPNVLWVSDFIYVAS